jgi:hypothetical protein
VSEYVTVESFPTDDPDLREIVTNQRLTEAAEEHYPDPAAGDVGSPIAQMLFSGVEGIAALTITEDTLLLRRDPGVPWESIVDDVRDALRDFFL